MNPIDVIEGRAKWAIVQADCLSPDGMPALPDRSVAHVITDPPFEEEAHRGAKRCPTPGDPAGDYTIGFDPITSEQRIAIAAQSARLAVRWGIYFCQVEGVAPWKAAIQQAGGRWRRSGIWIKPDSAPQFTGDRWAQGFECMAAGWFGSGKSKWNSGGKRGVYTHHVNNYGRITGDRRVHETQKPDDLMDELIRDFTDPGEIILDPFAGSGSTGVACIRLGRRFIGFERDPKHYQTALKRLMAAREQPELFAREKAKPMKQEALFGGTP